MIDINVISKIQNEYRSLVFTYKDKAMDDNMTDLDIRILIEHIQLFWYKYDNLVKYVLENICDEDQVAFLAGAVRLDIDNDGAYEFGIMGKYRIVNDPFVKMASFFDFEEDFDNSINMEYVVKYFNSSLVDTINLLENYNEDFWIFPLNEVTKESQEAFTEELLEVADGLILQMFSIEYNSIEELVESNESFFEIEKNLKPGALNYLIYDSIEDIKMSLEDRINSFINNQKIINDFGKKPGEIFYKVTLVNIMQSIDIINLSIGYKLIPFFRQEVPFNYFLLLIKNLRDVNTISFINESILGFVLQKCGFMIDGISDYESFKNKAMGHKFMDYLLDFVNRQKLDVLSLEVEPILQYANNF